MKGRHHIILETAHLKYEFDIKRNITVIQGDSATGKTTLVDLLNEYTLRKGSHGIRLESDVPCEVFTGREERWQYTLDGMQGAIVLIDEDYHFVFSRDFADYVQHSDQYFVIITRRPLTNLPYSINEIYAIRTSGKYHFPEQVYHELYPLYPECSYTLSGAKLLLLIEDAMAGYRFYTEIAGANRCISAGGNANIYAKILETEHKKGLLVIADGAAFGPYVERVVKLRTLDAHLAFYFPESFEWMILKSGVLANARIEEILKAPEEYIDSREYASWERYFTSLLVKETQGDRVRQYSKASLPAFYSSGKNAGMILSVIPEQIRKLL